MTITQIYDDDDYDDDVDKLVIDIFMPSIIQLRILLNDEQQKNKIMEKMINGNNTNIKRQLIEILKIYLNNNE